MVASVSRLLVLLVFLCFAITCKGQSSPVDSIRSFLASASIGWQMPAGDLADRFANNASLEASGLYKTKSNYLFEAGAALLFGNKLREDSLLKNVSTRQGFLVSTSGQEAIVRMFQRGYTLMARAGKIFPFKSINPNSGIVVMAGGGFIQHKIRIENVGNNVPQLFGDYKKGYDRLTNGAALTQSIGFFYMSKSRIANIRVTFEIIEGFTRGRRDWQFDMFAPYRDHRLDILYGFRFSWMIPFYKRTVTEYYY